MFDSITLLAASMTLLGQASPREPKPYLGSRKEMLEAIGQWNNQDSLMSPGVAALVFLLLISLLVLYKVYVWNRDRRNQPQPMLLFYQVAGRFNIDLKSQWLLVRIARQQGLTSPLTLLLCESTMLFHVQAYVKSLPRTQMDNVQGQIDRLCGLLFA